MKSLSRKKSNKVCFISSSVYPLFNTKSEASHGGAEIQLHDMAQELNNKKYFDISFVVGNFNQSFIESYGGIKLFRSFKSNDNFFLQIFYLLKGMFCANADIYVQRCLNRGLFFVALFSFIFRKKIIYMVAHDNEVNGKSVVYANVVVKVLLIFILRHVVDKIFVQSLQEYQDAIKLMKIDRKKLFILRKGVDCKKIAHQQTKKHVDGIWVGRCEKWKRPDLFLDLAKENPEKEFVMICSKTNDLETFNLIEERARLFANVTLYVNLKNKKVLDMLKISKVFVLTSKYEGEFPMTVLEALSFGLPILSLHVNPDNLIKEESLGAFCDNSVERMFLQFSELADKKRLIFFYENNIKYIKEKRSISSVSEFFSKVILE